MTRAPDPNRAEARNLRLSRYAGEAMRFFTGQWRGVPMNDVLYADMVLDESILVEMLVGLRHWAAGHAADYAVADRRAKFEFARQILDERPSSDSQPGKEVK